MSETKCADLMQNADFKALIEGFASVIQTCNEEGLDQGRKRCTAFFLSSVTRLPIHRVETISIPGRDGHEIPVRLYIPEGASDLPVVIYCHRGGWIFGNIEESDPVCRHIAHHTGWIVASVDYRLAPENPFPKPLHDCYDVTVWLSQNCAPFGGSPDKLIVFGESAGGNLAGGLALMARDLAGPKLLGQVLVYPMITANIEETAYEDCVDRHFITKEGIQFMWNAYLQSQVSPYASLDLADLRDLPPALVVTAQYDPLNAEGRAYAKQLEQSGVDVKFLELPEMIHGCLDIPLYSFEQKDMWIKTIKNLMEELFI